MKGLVLRVVVVLFAWCLQVLVLGYFRLGEARVDLLLVVTVYFGFKGGMMMGQTVGFGAGILEDLLSYKFFGVNMFIKTFIGAAIGNAHRKFFSESFLTIFVLMLAITCVCGVIDQFLQYVFFDSSVSVAQFWGYFVDVLVLNMVLNACVAPFVFSFLNRFNLVETRDL